MVDPDDAGRLAHLLDGAMVVVTAMDRDAPAGCLVGFHTQASIDPWRHLVLLSADNHTYRVALDSTHLAVLVLPADGRELARRFGGATADDGVDKFAAVRWHRSAQGPPVLDDAVAGLIGRVVGRFEAGDHVAFVLEPVESWLDDASAGDDGAALRYRQVEHLPPGHPRA